MENFAICLSFPVSFVCCVGYCILLSRPEEFLSRGAARMAEIRWEGMPFPSYLRRIARFCSSQIELRMKLILRLMAAVSWFVVAAFVLEVILVWRLGVIGTETLIGRCYAVLHSLLFLLAVPALANVLLLSGPRFTRKLWFLAAMICFAFAIFLVFWQYDVADILDSESAYPWR